MWLVKTKWGYFGRDSITGNLTMQATLDEAKEYKVEREARYISNTIPGSVVISKEELEQEEWLDLRIERERERKADLI